MNLTEDWSVDSTDGSSALWTDEAICKKCRGLPRFFVLQILIPVACLFSAFTWVLDKLAWSISPSHLTLLKFSLLTVECRPW